MLFEDPSPPPALTVGTLRDGRVHGSAIHAGDEILASYGRAYFKMPSVQTASFECGMLPLNIAAARGDLPERISFLKGGMSRVHPTASH